MSRYTSREELYNSIPLQLNENRDENILIDVVGNWIPECDIVYYGLLNSEYSEKLYKLKNTNIFKPRDIYLDTSYFSGRDLVRYLASPDDNLVDLDDKYIQDALDTAFKKYSYVPCNEIMLRHSFIELAYFDFIKSITLIYPWEIREVDYQYLKAIIPETVAEKFKIVYGDMLEFLEIKAKTDIRYTTIVSNSVSNIHEMIDNCTKYKTDASFFLLRNYSENVKYEIVDDTENPGNKSINFIESGTVEILQKLMDFERGIPKTKMRFARYEPALFSDLNPDPKNFNLGL